MTSVMATFDEFMKIDIRAGTVVSCVPNPKAKHPAYKLEVDFGPEIGVKKSSSQITGLYTPGDLIGTQVMAVVNFPPRQVTDFMSEVLILGTEDENGDIVLVRPEKQVPNGGRLY